MSKKPVAEYDQFQLRLPPGLRERVAEHAKKQNQSMNSVIVGILEEEFPAPLPLNVIIEDVGAFIDHGVQTLSPDDLKRLVEYLTQKIDEVHQEVNKPR